MSLYITAVKPKYPHKGDEAIFYLRDSEKQKTVVVEEKVGVLYVTKDLPLEDAYSLEKILKQNYPPINIGAYPKERIQVKYYSDKKRVLHLYVNYEEKEKLPKEFLRNVEKAHAPDTELMSAKEAKDLLVTLVLDEKYNSFGFELYDTKKGSYIEALCNKRQLRLLPDKFKNRILKSKPINSKEEAKVIHDLLLKKLNPTKNEITFVQYEFENKHHLKAIGTKEAIKKLKNSDFGNYFNEEEFGSFKETGSTTDPLHLNSHQRMLKWRFPIFSKVELKDGHIDFSKYNQFTQERVKLEEVLSDRICALDIEIEGWENGDSKYEHIYMATWKSAKEHLLYTVYDPKISEAKGAKIIVCKDENDLITKLAEKEKEEDPLFLVGHNIQNFDRIKLREYGKRKGYTGYKPGQNDDEPKIKSAVIGKTLTLSRFDIDTTYLRKNIGFLENNKLETHAQRAGFNFKKVMAHEDMPEKVARAKKGDVSAARELCKYTVEDGIISESLGKYCLEIILLKSYLFRCSPNDVCKTSEKELVDQLRQYEYFIKMNTHRDRNVFRKSRKKEVPDLDEIKFNFIGVKNAKIGRFSDAQMIYYSPFIEAFKDIIEHNPDAKNLLEKAKQFKNPDKKLDIIRTLNIYLAEPVEDFTRFLEKYGFKFGKRIDIKNFYVGEEKDKQKSLEDWILGQAYGSNKIVAPYKSINVATWNNKFCDEVERINKILENSSYINGKKFMIFEKLSEPIGIDFGKGFLVSVEPKRYVGIFNENIVNEGIRLLKRKKIEDINADSLLLNGIEFELPDTLQERKKQADFVKEILYDVKNKKSKKIIEAKLRSPLAENIHPDLKKVIKSAISDASTIRLQIEQPCLF